MGLLDIINIFWRGLQEKERESLNLKLKSSKKRMKSVNSEKTFASVKTQQVFDSLIARA